jgi:hypothetical protein
MLWAVALMNLVGMIDGLVPRRLANGMWTDGARLLALLRRR